MNNAPSFVPQGVDIPEVKMDVSKWDVALDSFDKKKYLDGLYAVLDYISPDLRKKYGDASQHNFSVPHGSLVVNMEIKDDKLYIKAPFIRLAEKNNIPLLRQVAQLNFSPMNLAQIELTDDTMQFKYECNINACEPYKIYYVLKEICHNGDRYDDDFVTKFSATLVHQPQIKQYDSKTLETLWNQVSAYINEAKEYLNYFDSKRLYYFSLDILSITFRKIDFYANPQGNVRNVIERTLAYIENTKSNTSLTDKINYGKQQLYKLLDDGKEKFLKDIYRSEVFVPFRYRGTLENIKENFKQPLESATKAMNNNDYMSGTLTLLYNFCNMYYYNDVPSDLHRLSYSALLNSSGKPWKEAANILADAMKKITEGNIQTIEEPKKKKGIFSSWFKN